MRTVSKLAAAAVGCIALSSAASAADLGYKKPGVIPVMAQYNWTGFYAGAHVGWGWLGGRTGPCTVAGNCVVPDADGVRLGAHAGYNHMFANRIVLGAEGSLSWDNLRGSSPCAAPAWTCKNGTEMSALLRARLGYGIDRLLLFVTAGGAYARFAGSTISPAGVEFKSGTDRWGWTVGAGAEYALTNNIILGAEYIYADYGKKNHAYDLAAPNAYPVPGKVHEARLRASYKF